MKATLLKLMVISCASFLLGAVAGGIGCLIDHTLEGGPGPVEDRWYWFLELLSAPGSWLAWVRSGAYDWGVDEQWSFRESVVLCNAFLWLAAGLLTLVLAFLIMRLPLIRTRTRYFSSAVIIAFVAGGISCSIGILASMPVYGSVFWYLPTSWLLSVLLLPLTLLTALYALYPSYHDRNA